MKPEIVARQLGDQRRDFAHEVGKLTLPAIDMEPDPKGPGNERFTFWCHDKKWDPKIGKPKGQKVSALDN